MALLVYSDKCNFCVETLNYIKTQPELLQILRFHNISTNGIPSDRIKRVPTLVTNEGKLYVGSEVRSWLESMVPMDISSFNNDAFSITNLDESEEPGNLFQLDMYGVPLQPVLTPELNIKINKKVNDAISDFNAR
jgi:hypothetical protein